MKLRSFIFLLSFLFLANTTANANDVYKVIKVVDGDTFYVDFNNNNIADKDERVRLNGIDAFEVKPGKHAEYQAIKYNLSNKEILTLGYLGQKFAQKELLNKKVYIEYSADKKNDKYNRPLISIKYKCKNEACKSYCEEILKAGFATVYPKSNLANSLIQFEDIDKIKANASKNINLALLNTWNKTYHSLDCKYISKAKYVKLTKKPFLNFKTAACLNKTDTNAKYKISNKKAKPNAIDENIELYFLSPLKQNKPQNTCTSNGCKALLYNIDNAKESIDFAIYGISDQDAILNALVDAQKRGVKLRWVTDLTEKKESIYFDTYRLMDLIPAVKNDYESQIIEEKTLNYKLPHAAIMHNKFFIFDKKIVFTGSTNISSTCLTGYNSNVGVLINSKDVADVFQQEFEQMYNNKFHNQKKPVKNNENIKVGNNTVSVYFSPANKTSKIYISEIQNAKNYIYVPAFYLTHKIIIDELIQAHKRGVDVKIIVDETSTQGKYVNIDYIINSGVNLKVENWAGKMHMKSMIIDDETLIIGSMNFTKQGENVNDENSLIIKSSVLTPAYKAHFLDLWKSIKE